MSQASKRCKFKSTITRWECLHEVLEDSKEGFCIFHERKTDKDGEKFNEGIKRITEDRSLDAFYFEGFFFPSSIDFSKVEFKKSVFFDDAEFWGREASFRETKFFGQKTSFWNAKFGAGKTDFGDAKFSGETGFVDASFGGDETSFGGAEFSGKRCVFMDARFVARTTSFGWAKFSGELTYFGKAQFLGESADFRAAEFVGRNTVFDRTAFCARLTDFQWSKFCGQKAEFNNVEFKNVVRFDTTALEAKTRFTGTDLTKCGFVAVDLKNVEFSLLDWDWKDKLSNETQPELIFRELSPQTPTVEGVRVALGIQRSAVETRKAKMRARLKTSEIYSQLKVQFHNKRDFTKAGMFHFRGQECKRMACMLPKDFFKWVFLWILKLSCGYGEKLRNVGLASFALVLAFAAAYTSLGLHDVSDGSISRNFGTCLIFSIKGFFPLWRFQQYKLVGDFANLIAGLEFILGAFMVGLFIYVFRRRMEK